MAPSRGVESLRRVVLLALGVVLLLALLLLRQPRREARPNSAGDAATVTTTSQLVVAPPPFTTAERSVDDEPPLVDFAAALAKGGPADLEASEFDGFVVRADDGCPVPFAEIVARTPSTYSFHGDRVGVDAWGLANRAGRFRIRTTDRVAVSVHADGLGWETTVYPSASSTTDHAVRFELVRAIVLDVRVFNPEGEPQPHAYVTAIGTELTCPRDDLRLSPGSHDLKADLGLSGADGRLTPAECRRASEVAFEVDDCGDTWVFPTTTPEDESAAIRHVDLRLTPHARIEASIRRSDGTPAPDVWLYATRRFESWETLEYWERSDEEGHCSLAVDAAGPYRLTLYARDTEGQSIEVSSCDVDLPAGTSSIELTVPGASTVLTKSTIESEVESPESPAAGAIEGHVELVSPSESVWGRVYLMREGRFVAFESFGEDGTFSFDRVEAGRYAIVVVRPGCTRVDGEPFNVDPGERLMLATVTLEPAPPILGRIDGADGRPLSDAFILENVIFPIQSDSDRLKIDPIDTAMTDERGEFVLKGVGAPVSLFVTRNGVAPIIFPLSRDEARSDQSLVRVAHGMRRLRGVVVLPPGIPAVAVRVRRISDISDAMLSGFFSEENDREVAIADDGSFEFCGVPATEGTLELRMLGGPFHSPDGWVVARRQFPSGEGDVDLGAWSVRSGGR